MGIVKDRAARGGKMVIASVAVVLIAARQAGDILALAARALDAVRPAKLHKALAALLVAPKKLNEFHEIHFQMHSGLRFAGLADSRIHI
jgi:cellobiose-specific phosphotransferase system component IIA